MKDDIVKFKDMHKSEAGFGVLLNGTCNHLRNHLVAQCCTRSSICTCFIREWFPNGRAVATRSVI